MRALCRNALAVLMLSLAGLPSPGGHSAASTREPARTTKPDSASAGRFIPVYKAAKQDDNKAEARQWREWKILEDFSEAMNDYIRIPDDIQVVAEECEEPNAFYQANVISLCYELGVSEREMFTQADNDADEVNDELYKSLMGTLFHEAGHAFIDVLELKITGKEEDVADQLVAYMLTNDEVGEDYLMTLLRLQPVRRAGQLPGRPALLRRPLAGRPAGRQLPLLHLRLQSGQVPVLRRRRTAA